MRLVQLVLDDEQRETVLDTLGDIGVDTVTTDDAERDATVVSFPLPTGAVDEVLGDLQDAGVETDDFLLVTDLETAASPNLGSLEDEYTQGPETGSRVPHNELQSTAREARPERTAFAMQVFLSATVAAAGLLLDSAVIIVGSMVISPFTNAVLSVSVGVTIDDSELVANSLKIQLFGFVLAIATGAGVGVVARWTSVVPPALALDSIGQVTAFSSPSLLVLAIAITAGGAGAVALATDQGVSIAGVAVSAAIVPAAAATGLGLVWRVLPVAIGAFSLLAVNVLLINVTAFVVLVILGYRGFLIPSLRGTSLDRRTVGRILLAGVVVVAAVATAAVTYQYISANREINHEISATLDSPDYDRLVLTGVDTSYTGFSPLHRNATVIIMIRKPADRRYPQLVRTLEHRIHSRVHQPVTVDVVFTDTR